MTQQVFTNSANFEHVIPGTPPTAVVIHRFSSGPVQTASGSSVTACLRRSIVGRAFARICLLDFAVGGGLVGPMRDGSVTLRVTATCEPVRKP